MKEKRRIFILTVMACFCTLVMQAQEVKSVSLDSIPKASLPKEGMSLEYSRPSLGGFVQSILGDRSQDGTRVCATKEW